MKVLTKPIISPWKMLSSSYRFYLFLVFDLTALGQEARSWFCFARGYKFPF